MAESLASLEKRLEDVEMRRKKHRAGGIHRDKKEGEKLLTEAKSILTKIENMKAKKTDTPEPLQ
jgi:hypothetical protein